MTVGEDLRNEFFEHAKEFFGDDITEEEIENLWFWVEDFPINLSAYQVTNFLQEGNWLF